jgi:hypothetical protein
MRAALLRSTAAIARRPQVVRAVAPLAPRLLSTTSVGEAPIQSTRLVAELERLSTQLPWWQSTLLRLGGTFSDSQWQAAAGADTYEDIVQQSSCPGFIGDGAPAALPDRFYTVLQVKGLHCWLAHVRLRQEAKERYEVLFREMMEKVWDQASLDLSRGEFNMGYIEISKHMKAVQFSWHGTCKALDAALETEEVRDEMAVVLLRNLYVDEEGEPLVDEHGSPLPDAQAGAIWLADYLLSQIAHQQAIPADEALRGQLTWLPPLAEGTPSAEAVE